jgi:stage II sporulation protein AA (anti-sigma F factor antagonist)
MSEILDFFVIFCQGGRAKMGVENKGLKRERSTVMSLNIQVKHFKSVLVVRLQGELDHHSAEKVRHTIERELAQETISHLVLNLADLDFMDSSGLGVILGRYKKVSQLGGKMLLCSIQPSVHRLMEMSGLFKILPTYEDEHSAILACGVAS